MLPREEIKIDIVNSLEGSIWVVGRAICKLPIDYESDKFALFPFVTMMEYDAETYCMLLNTNFDETIREVRGQLYKVINSAQVRLVSHGDDPGFYVDVDHKRMHELEWVTFEYEGIQFIDNGNEGIREFINKK